MTLLLSYFKSVYLNHNLQYSSCVLMIYEDVVLYNVRVLREHDNDSALLALFNQCLSNCSKRFSFNHMRA